MTRTSSPILWYGDLVDFGGFSTSASDNGKGKPISFSFGIDNLLTEQSRLYFVQTAHSFPISYRKGQQRLHGVTYSVSISASGERNYISQIKLQIENFDIKLDFEFESDGRARKATVNGVEISQIYETARVAILGGELLPPVRFVWPRSDDRNAPYLPEDHTRFAEPIRFLLRSLIHGRVADKTIEKLTHQIIANGLLEPDGLRRITRDHGERVREALSELASNPDRDAYRRLKLYTTAAQIPNIFRTVGGYLRSILSSTLYTGPARARSERYYRYQDLSVSEIDPDGKNFPMFLNSLNTLQMRSLSNWVQSLFGYGVMVSPESGHISIKLTEGDRHVNVVDVGYGVSQILPVLGQIWWARARPRRAPDEPRPLSLLAIEQPELHLHPAHQALLADALVGTDDIERASTNETPMHYLVETHSETLINRLGELVSQKKLAKTDVQVILFERDEADDRLSNVITAEFDDAGSLLNWPYGFFQPDVK